MRAVRPTKRIRINAALVLFGFSAVLFLGSLTLFGILLHVNHLLPHMAQASSGYQSWQIFDGGKDDPGTNYSESYLTTGNVSGLKLLWQASTPAPADDSVAYQANVDVGGKYENLAFVNTVKGNLIAYNALTGQKVWEADPSAADYNGQGTKSSPAIDPSGKYVYAYAEDGYVYKYAIATGAKVTGGGFPLQATLLPNNIEKGSSSINIANGYLYMAISANDGDYGHYVGHVVALNLSTGAKTVWNAECANITTLETNNSSASNYCSNTQAGIWARPGVTVDPVTGNVYLTTGNGSYNANSGGNNWGDSIIELTPNLSRIVDSYTPTDYSLLDSSDMDVGSSGPVLLPTVSGSSTPYMMVQVGKDNKLKLLNRANLSGQGGPRHTGGEMQAISYGQEVHEQPAVWRDASGNIWVYVTDEGGNLNAYKVVTTGGTSRLSLAYSKSLGVPASPFVANGVLYLDGNNILALNASTGAQLFSSSSLGVSLNAHWESPVVINGALYTPDYSGHVYALYVPGVTPTSAPTGPGTVTAPKPSSTKSGGTSTSKSSAVSAGSKPSPGTAKTPGVSSKTGAVAGTASGGTTAGLASLTLLVVGPNGKPVAHATVTLNNDAVAVTDATGRAVFSGLKPGAYTAKVVSKGARPYSATVVLGADQTKNLNVALTGSALSMTVVYATVGVAVVVVGGVGWGYVRFFHLPVRFLQR